MHVLTHQSLIGAVLFLRECYIQVGFDATGKRVSCRLLCSIATTNTDSVQLSTDALISLFNTFSP